MTRDEALAALRQEEEQQRRAFMAEYQALCQRHGLHFEPEITLGARGVVGARLVIAPNPSN